MKFLVKLHDVDFDHLTVIDAQGWGVALKKAQRIFYTLRDHGAIGKRLTTYGTRTIFTLREASDEDVKNVPKSTVNKIRTVST